MGFGGGGGGSAPDYGELAATQKEIYYDVKNEAQPFTEAGRDRALPTLLYQFGLGAKPYLTPDGQVVYENADGTYAGATETPVGGSNTAREQLDAMRRWTATNVNTHIGNGPDDPYYTYTSPDGRTLSQDDYTAEFERLRAEADAWDTNNAQPRSTGVLANLPAGSTALGEYQKTPGYDFRLQEGQRGLMSAMNAAGTGKDSGSTLKAMTKFGQDYATNDYNRWLSGVSQIAGYGQFGVSTTANAAQNYSGQLTNIAGMQQSAYDNAQSRNSGFLGGIGQLVGTLGGAAITGGVFS